jgi:ABC-type lipoprotein release transport system permease subunit
VSSGVSLWVRANWRRRRWSLLAMAILAGLSFAVVATAAAGARRTLSSFRRLRESTLAYDHGIAIDAPDSAAGSGDTKYDDATVARIRALPEIQRSGAVTVYIAALPGAPWEFGLYAPEDTTVGTDIEHGRVLRGRMPDPNNASEVAVNEASVAQAHVDVGSTLTVETLTPEQRSQLLGGDVHATDQGLLGPKITLHVVGVVRALADVVGRSDPTLLSTPAFDRQYRSHVAYSTRLLLVRRAPGVSADQLHRALDATITGTRLGDFDADVEDRPAIRTVRTLGVALAVFALVAGLVIVVALNQVVSREVAASDADDTTLTGIGLTRAQRVKGAIATVAPAVAIAAVIAVAASVLASTLMPVGLARRVEPSPGIRFDTTIAVAAFVATALILLVEAFVSAVWMTRHRAPNATEARGPRGRTSAVDAAVSTVALGPAGATGVRLAFDRRSPVLPVRSALIGIGAGMAVVVGALTFLASLDRLDRQPDRWGYGWDLTLDSSPDEAGQLVQALSSDRNLSGRGVLTNNFTFIKNGQTTDGVLAYGLEPAGNGVGYALLSGLQPVGPDEVVIGPSVAHSTHASIGDFIEVSQCPCSFDPTHVTMSRVRVVGISLFPEDDNGNFNAALGFSASGFARHVGQADTTRVAVAFRPHANPQRVADDLTHRFPGQVSAYGYPTRPGEVTSLLALRRFPIVLAVVAALLSVAVLTNLLLSTQQRRRRLLATLRSIGFTPADTTRTSIWQSIAVTATGALIGIVAGVVSGTLVWYAATHGIGIATDALRPATQIALSVGVTLAVAVVLGGLAGLRGGRSTVAASLHDE